MVRGNNWIGTLFIFAARCKGKMLLSVICAIISVAAGIVPYFGVYKIISMFIEGVPAIGPLLFWSAVCLTGYLLKLLFHGISTSLSHISAYTILEAIRLKIADKLMKAPLGSVLNETAGKFKNTIVDRVEAIEVPLAHVIPEMISHLLLPIGVFIYLWVIDWRMALAALVTMPVAGVLLAVGLKGFNKRYEAYMKASNHVNSVIVEYVEGIEVIKTFNQSAISYEKFAKAVSSFKNFTMAWFESTWALMNLSLSILPSTLLWTLPVGTALYLKGALTPSELTMCLILSMGIVGPLTKFAVFVNDAKAMEYVVNDADKLLNLPELPNTQTRAQITGYDVELKDVSFSYGAESADVLHGVNLRLPQGSFSALVGPSGGGKTTVARLIARFWDVTDGSISIGGRDVRQIPLSQLAELISYVTQDNFLFNCSLKENIRLGKPSATDEEVFEAAKAARCAEFILRLENGYDTSAGEAGKRLSGGEKQRIAIARAILKNAPIVILDEATAFTDPENEEQIQKSITALTRGKTLLVIAHRLSTIKNAGQIIVLKKGHVVRVGTHSQLLEECPLYRDMWQAHIGAKIWSAADGKRKETKGHV
ncbi:MAG: ABC transporter ATP-binding protein [Syntrophomonadaceae bacterium]|nr:ABC transporter ATP-binding protein [Syntrophomonadaceae bacterium]